jgi:hypothetical protein
MSQVDEDLIDDDAADRLLAELTDVFAAEITDDYLDAAVNAFWVARTDALVAELDEHLDAGQRASVRGNTDARQHLFRLDALSVSLTVDAIDRRVEGRISQDCSSARWLDASGSSRPLDLDDRRRFAVTPEHGPAAVEIALADGRLVRTRWTLL